mmetsp:Transcript_2724/g.5489  ORF Transcript_2724/g.5489 Transcript_2724/m.5489 type:complete len:194 (+) Transcript_2724:187-768(+)
MEWGDVSGTRAQDPKADEPMEEGASKAAFVEVARAAIDEEGIGIEEVNVTLHPDIHKQSLGELKMARGECDCKGGTGGLGSCKDPYGFRSKCQAAGTQDECTQVSQALDATIRFCKWTQDDSCCCRKQCREWKMSLEDKLVVFGPVHKDSRWVTNFRECNLGIGIETMNVNGRPTSVRCEYFPCKPEAKEDHC